MIGFAPRGNLRWPGSKHPGVRAADEVLPQFVTHLLKKSFGSFWRPGNDSQSYTLHLTVVPIMIGWGLPVRAANQPE